MTEGSDASVTLSLISHTNVGKTTLARTLLKKDVGEVLDQPHVTDVSDAFTLLETPAGETLRLWDTPGFGDTARLLRRLKGVDNPLGWFLGRVWDRFADRALWCSQQAVRNVRDDADIVLYLVNAAESPGGAGYVEMEMEILSWMKVPVVVLLNQTGPPRERAVEAAEEARWRAQLEAVTVVKAVLSLDAFARCWVQEGILFDTVDRWLPSSKQKAFRRLTRLWREENARRFRESMHSLGRQLAGAVCDRAVLEKSGLTDRLRRLILFAEAGDSTSLSGKETGMALLAERLDGRIRTALDELIRLHELSGNAATQILRRLRNDYAVNRPVHEGISAILGGVVSGALLGLGADLAAGGLTFGGGALVGGLLGAAGAGGLARGYNLVRGESAPSIRWSFPFFQGLVRSALLRYLAVAHYGRGRGKFTESEHPTFWQDWVARAVEPHQPALLAIWERVRGESDIEEATRDLTRIATSCAREVLIQLYPQSERFLDEADVNLRS